MHLNRRRPDLASEQGVAMLVVLMALVAGAMVSTVALAAAGGDLPFARESQDRKQAYAAAEAGLEYYMFQLSNNNDYWTLCDTGVAPAPGEQNPVNQAWNGQGRDPRRWRTMPGTKAKYTIELLPASGAACMPGGLAAQNSMVDRASGTFRIRATGSSGDVTRTIVTRLRRRSFLDYIYFTDYETLDPTQYPDSDDAEWAGSNCVKPRASRPSGCQDIQFRGTDEVNGPLHTNDDLLTCGGTTFGREGKEDVIEVTGPAGWKNASGCSGSPKMNGKWIHPAQPLTIPPTNSALASIAEPAYRYTGRTTIVLRNNVMDVTTADGVTRTNVALPSNGVIYVNNGACSGTKTPLLQRYDDPAGCAVVYVRGTYSKSLTIGSANDVVVNGNLTKDTTTDAVLGLIANNNVRVYHPVTRSNWSSTDSCTNATGTMHDVTIEAAILALTHSFVVDNPRCGKALGDLNVTGAIAQRFRGIVGTTTPTGYTKNYVYDDRLKYRSPPYFLDPVQAAWKINRANEQVPAVFER